MPEGDGENERTGNLMIELNDDKTLFFFDRDLEPVLTVTSGETVRIRTKD